MFKTILPLLFCLFVLPGCSDSGAGDSHPQATRTPQVYSSKNGQLATLSEKIVNDMTLTENGDLYVANMVDGKLAWVKSETFKTNNPAQKGERGNKFFVGNKEVETTTDKLQGDILVDSLTGEMFIFGGFQFMPTGLVLRGEKGDKGDKGDAGTNGLAGLNGVNGTNGVDGANGVAGKDGKDGANGQDGSSCSVSKSGNVTTISCTNGTSASVSDGVNGSSGGSSGSASPSVLTKGYLILKASRDYQTGAQNNVNMPVDSTRTIVLPESLQVTYGNAGNYTAKICVNGVCCTYKGGADINTPLNPGYLNQWNTSTSRSDIVQIEKGRQYRFQSCDSGTRTIVVHQYHHIYMGIDYGDPSMMTEITATIEVK